MEKPNQPGIESESLLNDVMNDGKSPVSIGKKTYRIGWLKRGTIRKITDVILKKGNDDKSSCQVAAAIVLNDYWKIRFFWPILWRWMYYIRQWGDEQLQPIVEEGKKKIPAQQYYLITILTTAMKDTMMTMTKAEVERFLQEQRMEQQ